MDTEEHPLQFGVPAAAIKVFLHTYWNWMKGQSLVKDESEEHMNPKAGKAPYIWHHRMEFAI